MSKKDPERESLRYLETPTAAFPIGSLGLDGPDEPDEEDEQTAVRHVVEDLDREETRPRRPRPRFRSDEHETELQWSRAQLDEVLDETQRSEGKVHPVLLALSLLGGGVLAVGVVAVVGMLLLYVN